MFEGDETNTAKYMLNNHKFCIHTTAMRLAKGFLFRESIRLHNDV